MKEFIEKLIGRLNDRMEYLDSRHKILTDAGMFRDSDTIAYRMSEVDSAKRIVNGLAEEYNDSWITDRAPTKEECKGWRGTFQATILQGSGDEQYTTTVALQYEYTTVRGKEVSRWLFKEKIAPWEPIAWKPLSEPYQL